jgi:hypothetical protein
MLFLNILTHGHLTMLFLNILTQALSLYNVIPKHYHTSLVPLQCYSLTFSHNPCPLTMLFLNILTQSLSPYNVIPKHSHTILVPLQCYS